MRRRTAPPNHGHRHLTLRRRVACATLTVLAAAACTPPAAQEHGAGRTVTPAPAETAAAPPTSDPACPRPCRRRPRVIGRFRTALAPEASGIAAGQRNPELLYILDDGPGTTSLLVVRARTGRAVGQLSIQGLDSVDSEGLALGACGAGDARPCIYIGDIGDNTRSRDTITVTRVLEPDLTGGVSSRLVEAATATWRYPDGAHDAEALLADGNGTLGIVTKSPGRRGRGAARLYLATEFGDQTLRRGPRIRLKKPAVPLAAAVVGNVVTGADISRVGVVIRTYDAIYEFLSDGAGGLDAFPSWRVREVRSPAEGQGEAVTYAADGCGLFTVSEGSGQITAIPCR